MKVMCISTHDDPRDSIPHDRTDPAIGDICTVVQVVKRKGCDWYCLKEFHLYERIYRTNLFAPLSDIDENEIHKVLEEDSK